MNLEFFLVVKKPTYEELEKRIQEFEQSDSEYGKIKEALKESKDRFKLLCEKVPLPNKEQPEIELNKNDEKYYQLFKTISDAIMIFDSETRNFVDANDAVTCLYGYSKEEFVKLNHSDITVEPDESDKSNTQTIKGKVSNITLRYHRRKDGTIFPVEITTGNFKQGERQFVFGVVRDITIRKKKEDALIESEEKYRIMIETTPDAVYICSRNFFIEYMNPAMILKTGRDATGETCYKAIHELEKKCSWCLHHRVIQKGESCSQVTTSPKNNHVFHVSHAPLVNRDGSISKVTIYRDITELKQFEEMFKKSENKVANFTEKKATLLLTDMVDFTKKTLHMNTGQVSKFLIDYRKELETIIRKGKNRAQYFESAAGDATASVFENRESENLENKSIRAFKVVLQLIGEIKKKKLSPTRFGLYGGKVLQAQLNERMFRFGNSFSAASRLQELCDYFDTPMLMDRNVALAQQVDSQYIACIGKVTPKSLEHPIHIFTIYKPGIHRVPLDVDKKKLIELIKLKNQSVEHFHGNSLKNIQPNFLKARNGLNQVSFLFKEITGHTDIASEIILEFIRENVVPSGNFLSEGIKLQNKNGYSSDGVNLYRLSRELLKALDAKFYNNFVLDTSWQDCFKFQWKEKGEIIIEKDAELDGVYFLTKGNAHVIDGNNNIIAEVKSGDIFGEMAYFSIEKTRMATVKANTDLELYFISGEDFMKYSEIKNLFERIAKSRKLKNENEKFLYIQSKIYNDPPSV